MIQVIAFVNIYIILLLNLKKQIGLNCKSYINIICIHNIIQVYIKEK